MIRFMSLTELVLFQYANLVTVFLPGFFYLPSIFLHPSIESIGLCLVGAIIGLFFRLSLTYLEDIKRQNELLRGYLKPFSKCDFHKFQIDDYAEEGSSIRLDAMSLPFHVAGRTSQLNAERNIELYVVKRGHSSSVPSQLAAYESLSYGHSASSYIFVRDEPNKITPLGRFFVYHEVGHTSSRNAESRVTALLGWRSFLLAVPLAMASLQFGPISLAMLSLYVVALVIAYPIYRRLLQYSRLHEEVSADRFAQRCLSHESRQALAQYLRAVGQLPRDLSVKDSVGEYIDSERSKLLLQDLNESGNSSEVDSPLEIEYTYSRPIVYIQILFALFIPALGFLSRPPSIALLCGVNGALLTLVSGIGSWLLQKRSRLREEIKSYLSENNQS